LNLKNQRQSEKEARPPLQSKEGHCEKAWTVYERMLALEMDQVQRANIHKRIGDICLNINRQKNDPLVCERAIAAYEEALTTFSQESHPIARAKVMTSLGSAYVALADHKNRAKNLKQAAICWQEALSSFTPAASPNEHVSIQNELGSAYRKLAELESREENNKKAVAACKASLAAINPIDSPLQFAAAKAFLASSYLAAAQAANPEDHKRLCKDAISAYREAIQLYSPIKNPLPYAALKNNLAIAILSLSEAEDREANCRLALEACRDALVYRTEKEHPLAYAATQNNLASAYLALAEEAEKDEAEAKEGEGIAESESENEKYCQLALEACNNALRIYSRQESGRLYATAQNNLANVLLTLGHQRKNAEERAENCLRAILAAQKALEVFTLEDSPEDYGEAKGILWMAYLNLAEIEYPSENSALALEACEERLHSYRVWQAHPLQVASCCKDLAMTAISLADNEITKEARAQDCKKAIAACEEALQIYDKMHTEIHAEIHTEKCAEAKILLWAAYSALAEIAPIEGKDRKENCLRAIEACRDAIAIYERIDPAEHADALRSLSYSFIAIAEIEEKADNCRRAIDACKMALQYYTPERSPAEHADILRDLAYDYLALSEVQDKEECSNKALKACKKASRIYSALAIERARKGDPEAGEMKEKAERAQLSMQSCKAVLRAGRKAGPRVTTVVPAKNKRNHEKRKKG
jgi:tetratricopeptide (TPR) repeat protein